MASRCAPRVLSARAAKDDTERDRFEGLAFRIDTAGELKIATRMGNNLLLTPGGRQPPTAPDEPILVVGSAISKTRIPDLAAFASERLAKTAQVKDVTNSKGRALKIAGLAAYELTARAKDLKTGKPLALYQVVISDKDGYHLLQGMVGAEGAEPHLAHFRKVAESFRLAR